MGSCRVSPKHGQTRSQREYRQNVQNCLLIVKFSSRNCLPAPSPWSKEVRRRRYVSPASSSGNVAESEGPSPSSESAAWRPPLKLIALCGMVLTFGVANRVLYRMALVPMQDYIFFLAQLQNVHYLVVYFGILFFRFRSGAVTASMISINKIPLIMIGACEGISQLLFMISSAHLPGLLLPIINQSYLVWNLLFATVLLGARFNTTQILGCCLIMAGVAVAAVSPSKILCLISSVWQTSRVKNLVASSIGGVGPELAPSAEAVTTAAAAALAESAESVAPLVDPVYVVACVLCFAFPALASTIKEKLFVDARKQLGRSLDIFVVNSFGSLFQFLFVLLLLPLMLSVNHIPLEGLPSYLSEGARCFQGLPPSASGPACDGAPMLPLLYVAANLLFNISMLTLLKSVGTVTTTITGSCLVPLTIIAFMLPLPYLEPAPLQTNIISGCLLLLAGLFIYNFGHLLRPAGSSTSGGASSSPQPLARSNPESQDELPHP